MTIIKIPASEPNAQRAYIQLCNSMALNDTRAVAIAICDLGYDISIYIRHIANHGDHLEIWSALHWKGMI